MICIFTDGACSSKSKIGGWGFQVIECNGTEKPLIAFSGARADTTNNEMELTAFSEALNWVAISLLDEPITIYSDSAYIVNCFQDKWYEKWQKNGWKTANKTPVKHRKIWEDILNTIGHIRNKTSRKNLKLYIMKVSAHTGNKGNETADQLAVGARKELAIKGE